MLARGELTEGHARAVLARPDDDARRRLARGSRGRPDGSRGREGGPEGGAKPSPHDAGRRPGSRRARADRRAAADRPRDARDRGKLELHFGDETGLAELVETLEAL